MQKPLIALLTAALLSLAGCQGGAYVKAAPAKPELSLEAQVALMQAETDVKLANSKAKDKAGGANKALALAQEAAAKGDSPEVVKHSQAATKEALKAMK